jgi:hypothetical protein
MPKGNKKQFKKSLVILSSESEDGFVKEPIQKKRKLTLKFLPDSVEDIHDDSDLEMVSQEPPILKKLVFY